MEWDHPHRSKVFGGAALLVALAGLSCIPESSEPLLNENLGDLPAEAALKNGSTRRSIRIESAASLLQDDWPVPAGPELKDAPASPPGLSLPNHFMDSPAWKQDSARRPGTAGESLISQEESPTSLSPRQAFLAQAKRSSSLRKTQERDVARSIKGPPDAEPSGGDDALSFPRPVQGRRKKRAIFENKDSSARYGRQTTSPSKGKKAHLGNPKEASYSSGSPRPAASSASSRGSRKRFRPLLLSSLLGKNAIRPPRGPIAVPDFSGLAELAPKLGPDGRPWKPEPGLPEDVESWRPPERFLTNCRRSQGHWHQASGLALYHHGKAWGMTESGRLGWLARSKGRWWAWNDAKQPTWVSYQGHWWWNSQNVWFLLHEAQAWGYRLFLEGRAEGLFHPASGTSMVYSEDGKRVAVVTPGEGAVLFDAVTGEELGRWSEEQIKPLPKLAAPSNLTLPP